MLTKFKKVFLNSILAISILASCVSLKKEKELVGKITFKQLKKITHDSEKWFAKEYDNYSVDSAVLKEIIQNTKSLEDISIQIFMGTWCSDSRREVPRFYKILNYLDITTYSLVGLDRNKKSPQQSEKELNILYVPTFIIYKKGKELDRIIEIPKESLENDLKRIIYSKK